MAESFLISGEAEARSLVLLRCVPLLNPMGALPVVGKQMIMGCWKTVRGGAQLLRTALTPQVLPPWTCEGSHRSRKLPCMQQAPGSTPSPAGRALNDD